MDNVINKSLSGKLQSTSSLASTYKYQDWWSPIGNRLYKYYSLTITVSMFSIATEQIKTKKDIFLQYELYFYICMCSSTYH